MKHSLQGIVLPDTEGFLKNDLNVSLVQKNWLAAAKDFIDYFNTYKDTNIHSVYLRGSAANGTAVDFFSDIDFYVISKKPVSDFDVIKIKKYADRLNAKYPFISRFDVGYFMQDQIITQKEGSLLKVTALCLYGNNISELIPAPKPGNDMNLSISQLEHDILKIKSEALEGFYNDPEKLHDLCIWISKKIIRSGFELVAEREQCFTRNLISCCTIFSKHHPEYSNKMQEVIELFLYQTTDVATVLRILEDLGLWLVDEYKKSPEKLLSSD
jgi:uncharacterized protein